MDGFASFRYKSNDELRYVLTYGLYPSTESAGFDSEMLLSRVSGFKTTPQLWVRQLRPIQESIRTTLQK
jgi:septal ring-binding cell division protein DamX